MTPDEVGRLEAALDNLDQWVGAGPNGDKWRDFLRSPALRAEMAKGDQAEPSVVVEDVDRLSSNLQCVLGRRVQILLRWR